MRLHPSKLLAILLVSLPGFAGTIGVKPYFCPPEQPFGDGIALHYHLRVNKITATSLKIIFSARRLWNPSCAGASCQTYLLESNVYTHWIRYGDQGCNSWPPESDGTVSPGQPGLWMSIPDYNQHGWVGVRPVDTASQMMFPRIMTGIDNISALTKIETISQMNIASQDVYVEYARQGTFQTPLTGWGSRFDPSAHPDSGTQPPCVTDLPAGQTYRIWKSTVTIGGQSYSEEFAVPDAYATNLDPDEIFSITTEFLDKQPSEVDAGNGDLQVYFWGLEVERESTLSWVPLSKMKVFYRADPNPNIGWGAKIGSYLGAPVLEISNDGSNSYYQLNDAFDIQSGAACASPVPDGGLDAGPSSDGGTAGGNAGGPTARSRSCGCSGAPEGSLGLLLGALGLVRRRCSRVEPYGPQPATSALGMSRGTNFGWGSPASARRP